MRLPAHRKSVYDAMFETHSPEDHRRYYEKHWALHQKLVAERLQSLKEQSQQEQSQPSQGQPDPTKQIPAQQIPTQQIPAQRISTQQSTTRQRLAQTQPAQIAPTKKALLRQERAAALKRDWPDRNIPDVLNDATCQQEITTRLAQWGLCIRFRRMRYERTAQMLSQQVGVSLSTVRRVERGDPNVSASTYLLTMAAVGLLDDLLKEPEDMLLSRPYTDGRAYFNHFPRARIRKWQRRTIPF